MPRSKTSPNETKQPPVKEEVSKKKASASDKKTVKKAVHVKKETKNRSTKNDKMHNTLQADVFDIQGKVIEQIELPKSLFGAVINKQLMAQAVRVYLANQRKGTSSTKSRGEVQGSTRKIYKQKETRKAHHDAIKPPFFFGVELT